jgi:hypothetical protein
MLDLYYGGMIKRLMKSVFVKSYKVVCVCVVFITLIELQ